MCNTAKTVLLVVGVFFCCSVLGCGGGGGGGGDGASASGGTNSQLESEVFRELNLARTESATYAGFLREYKSHIINQGGTEYYAPPGKTKIRLKEGTAAVDEAIAELESKTPVGALTLSKGMSLGAHDHVLDKGPKGGTGHDGTDGSSGGDRINRYGTWHSGRGENIQYGNKDARGIVMQLIIDDSTPSRGHRENIYNPAYTVVGIACGPHTVYGSMCVQDFANAYTEKD